MNIHDMKKVNLHIHLDGSLRPETVYNWIQEEKKDINLEQVKKLLMVDKDCRNLNQYLTKFALPVEMLQTKAHIKQSTYELFEDLAKENVIYAEVRFAPSLHTQKDLTYSEIVEAAIEGMNEAKKQYNIKGNLILCCMRGENNKRENLETIQIAAKYLNKGVCGIDLAGAEALYKTKNFEEEFNLAKKLNIPFTIHAGEADGPESIRTALEFGAKRIGHGVRCIEDKNLMAELIKKQILLEICPTSNLQTQAIQGEHPLEKIYKSGIKISINTDNNSVSNTNLEQEYNWILQNTNLKIEDLVNMNINAIRGAFITPKEKAELVFQINEQSKKEEKFKYLH